LRTPEQRLIFLDQGRSMSIPLSKEKEAEVIQSIVRFFGEKLDLELSEVQARSLLAYLFHEITPFAYNQGVEDAQQHLVRLAQDLPGTCFQEALTYWECRQWFASSSEAAELSIFAILWRNDVTKRWSPRLAAYYLHDRNLQITDYNDARSPPAIAALQFVRQPAIIA
jgi:uncharacterized protein (DUF2164 family)